MIKNKETPHECLMNILSFFFFSNFYFSTVIYSVSGVQQSESVHIYLLDSFRVEVIAEY